MNQNIVVQTNELNPVFQGDPESSFVEAEIHHVLFRSTANLALVRVLFVIFIGLIIPPSAWAWTCADLTSALSDVQNTHGFSWQRDLKNLLGPNSGCTMGCLANFDSLLQRLKIGRAEPLSLLRTQEIFHSIEGLTETGARVPGMVVHERAASIALKKEPTHRIKRFQPIDKAGTVTIGHTHYKPLEVSDLVGHSPHDASVLVASIGFSIRGTLPMSHSILAVTSHPLTGGVLVVDGNLADKIFKARLLPDGNFLQLEFEDSTYFDFYSEIVENDRPRGLDSTRWRLKGFVVQGATTVWEGR